MSMENPPRLLLGTRFTYGRFHLLDWKFVLDVIENVTIVEDRILIASCLFLLIHIVWHLAFLLRCFVVLCD